MNLLISYFLLIMIDRSLILFFIDRIRYSVCILIMHVKNTSSMSYEYLVVLVSVLIDLKPYFSHFICSFIIVITIMGLTLHNCQV